MNDNMNGIMLKNHFYAKNKSYNFNLNKKKILQKLRM